MIDDQHVVRGLGLRHVMRREDDREPERFAQVSDRVPNLLTAAWVEACGGFVEKQGAGAVQQGPGDVDTALLPTREHPVPAIHEIGQADHLPQFFNPRIRQVVERRTEAQVLPSGQKGIEQRLLENHPDLLADPVVVPGAGQPVDVDDAGVEIQQRGEAGDRSGFARTILTEQGEQRPIGHLETEVVHRDNVAETSRESLDRNHAQALPSRGQRSFTFRRPPGTRRNTALVGQRLSADTESSECAGTTKEWSTFHSFVRPGHRTPRTPGRVRFPISRGQGRRQEGTTHAALARDVHCGVRVAIAREKHRPTMSGRPVRPLRTTRHPGDLARQTAVASPISTGSMS